MEKSPDNVTIIDQTLREGMQYQGLVFSLEQRLKMLEFQEQLGIDVCQAGYPPAHPLEAEMVTRLAAHAREKGWRIRVAALGRMMAADARRMADTGIRDFHFHIHLRDTAEKNETAAAFKEVDTVTSWVKKTVPGAVTSLAVLDMGRTRPETFEDRIGRLGRIPGLDILSLPDTSGIMAPNQVAEKIRAATALAGDTILSIHCHNDTGMASANTLTGVLAGARAMEATALGIGERNGIADLFTTACHLKAQGIGMNMDTDNRALALEYYAYVNTIVEAQTGHSRLRPDTPAFGSACATHVAGTHADSGFGTVSEERFFLNPLCGRRLVEKYLARNNIPFAPGNLDRITAAVKAMSFSLGRRLTSREAALAAQDPEAWLSTKPAPAQLKE